MFLEYHILLFCIFLVAENHPRVVQIMAPSVLKNMVLAAGPAQFGMDLNENFAVRLPLFL